MPIKSRWPFIFLVLMFSAASQGQAMTPDNAAGIPWGASPEAVKTAMKDRPEAVLAEDTADHLLFKGGTLAGLPLVYWRFKFVDSKMTMLNVSFVLPAGKDNKGSYADQTRASLRRQLDQKFGRPSSEAGNNWYHQCNWKWPNMEVKGASKEVTLMDAWHDGYLGVTYFDHPAPATPPANPSASPKPDYFGQPGKPTDL